MLQVRIDTAAMDRITKEIQSIPGAMERLMPPALNAAAAEMKTDLAREFGARMDLQRKASIKDRLELSPKAAKGAWTAGVRISLARFLIGSFRDVQQTAYGVGWTTGGSTLRGGWIPRAFIVQGVTQYKSGEYQGTRMVLRRAMRGEKGFTTYGMNRAGHQVKATRAGDIVQRYSLKALRGPSLAYAFSGDSQFQAQAEATGGQILEKKVQQQVNRILKT